MEAVWNCKEILCKRLIIVEGRDDENLLGVLCNNMNLLDIQMFRIEGESSYNEKIHSLKTIPGFGEVEVLGFMRDADDNPGGKVTSIQHALEGNGFAVPSRELERVEQDPSICFMVIPSSTERGSIENICLEPYSNDPVMTCVNEYYQCLSELEIPLNSNAGKVKLYSLLASRPNPGLKIGEAARAEYFDFEHPCFNQLKNFLNLMMQ